MLVTLRGCEGRFSIFKAPYNNLTMSRACNYPFHSQGLLSDSPYFLPCNLVFNSKNFSFFVILMTLACLIWYWYCMEMFSLGHSWELNGLSQAFSSKVLSTNHEVTISPTPSLVGGGEGLSCNRLNMYSSILSRG